MLQFLTLINFVAKRFKMSLIFSFEKISWNIIANKIPRLTVVIISQNKLFHSASKSFSALPIASAKDDTIPEDSEGHIIDQGMGRVN